MKTPTLSLLCAGVIALASMHALAQPADPGSSSANGGNPPQTLRHSRHGGMQGRMDSPRMQEMMARRHAELKTKLKITPEQEGAWSSFTEAMKPSPKAQLTRPDAAELAKLSTPERIDRMRATRKEHWTGMQAEMDKRDEATKVFYNALSADQKKTFDAEHARMGQRMQRHHGGRPAKDAGAPK